MNLTEIKQAISRLAEGALDVSKFPFQFLETFENNQTMIKRFRSHNMNKSNVEGGVLKHNNSHIAVVSRILIPENKLVLCVGDCGEDSQALCV